MGLQKNVFPFIGLNALGSIFNYPRLKSRGNAKLILQAKDILTSLYNFPGNQF